MTRILLLLLAAAASAGEDNLTREYAAARREQVAGVEYELSFRLDKGSAAFAGRAVIDAELGALDRPLGLDFVGRLRSASVNGKPAGLRASAGRIEIPAPLLAKRTVIELEWEADFSSDGRGVLRSVDPEDGAEYLATDFEPYQAHRLFPCFDQPDIKAVYRLTVDAPSDWTVVANEPAESESSSGGRRTTAFAPTKPLSPYLVFLAAGPFAEWRDEHEGLPLTIHARRTLAKHVDAERLFAATKKGLSFFGEYFGSPYPFPKYGHVFVPEFDHGAMENPGAVAVNERYIFRGAPSRPQLDDRDELIMHEMAHMWFGDLVTMRWWDDLWLNESFASYAASLAMDRALGAPGAWIRMFSSKTWGYWQDSLSTTHPIETDVPDIHTVKGNFDGITYAKGAAAIKQLHFHVGEDGFREGLRAYFKAFAFDNTTRADFIAAIAGASRKDLDGWTKAWLQTAGPHRVSADWDCADGRVSRFSIRQSTNASGALSPHRARVGLFAARSGELALAKSADVSYAAAETAVPALRGAECPDFVHLNLDDQDYALAALDAASLKSAGLAIRGGLKDPLLRLMTWFSLAQMVKEGALPPSAYFDAALPAIAAERDDAVLGVLLGRYSPVKKAFETFLDPAARAALAPRLEEAAWRRAAAAAPGSSEQKTFHDFHAAVATSSGAAARLERALDEGGSLKGLALDQDRRWHLVSRLAVLGGPGALARVDAEEKRDSTLSGRRRAWAARAALPERASKERAWREILDDAAAPFSTRRLAARTFHSWDRPELAASFADRWYAAAASTDWAAREALIDLFFEDLFPKTDCSEAALARARSELGKAGGIAPLARRAWRESVDELEACVRARLRTGS